MGILKKAKPAEDVGTEESNPPKEKRSILKSRPPPEPEQSDELAQAETEPPKQKRSILKTAPAIEDDVADDGQPPKGEKKSILKSAPKVDIEEQPPTEIKETPKKKKSILKSAPPPEEQVTDDAPEEEDAGAPVAPKTDEKQSAAVEKEKPSATATPRTADKSKKKTKKMRREKSDTSGPSRDSTFIEDAGKAHEKSYSHWVAAKGERRLQEQTRLTEKIRLQAELIQAQDELYERKKRQAEISEKKKRQLEKEARHAREEELVKICQESMDRDRKRREERMERQKKQLEVKSESVLSASPNSASNLSGECMPGHRKSAVLFTGYDPSTLLSTNQEQSDEDVSDREELSEDQLAELPWHHAQLYRLYGHSGADSFIHPKIEQKPKKPVPQKMRRQGGRAGAAALWSTLREDSVKKLLREDRHIPEELKKAYGSFVRQLLRKKRKPVKRNFFATEDVPEMDRLLDNSVLLNVADYRHKVGMMHHASIGNEDRGNVIMHNNPPPDFNNFEGQEGIDRYLPSWIHEHWDLESSPEYKKWLNQQATETDLQSYMEEETLPSEAPLPLAEIPEGDELEPLDDLANDLATNVKEQLSLVTEEQRPNEWDFMLVKKKAKPSPRKPTYQFLTEKQASVPGQFSLRYSELRDNRDIPRPVSPSRVQGSKSAMAMVGGTGSAASSRHGSSLDSMLSSGGGSVRHSAPTASHQEQFLRRYADSWEPLSMRALIEYKDHVGAPGTGEFGYGRPQLWSKKSPIDV